jgi:hypothetical protein
LKAIGPLVVWTFFVWTSRIRNVFSDDGLDAFDRTWRTGVAVVFIGFAVAMGVALWRSRRSGLGVGATRLLAVFASWTVAFWVVRGTGMLFDGNHDAGFKAIHTVLAVFSIGLAALALRGRTPTRATVGSAA